jgi:type IV secretion system protein VirB2
MKNLSTNRSNRFQASKATLAALTLMPSLAWAQANSFGGADEKVEGFLSNITGLLNIASIAVVTIAIIFAGYQIAFAHKRISDVAPILVGGLLIGAAGQIAKMVIGNSATETAMLVASSLSPFYA